jgi:NAD(P) transhydrogenase subunit alpha
MRIGLIKEPNLNEHRLPATPATCKKLVALGCNVNFTPHFGEALHFSDAEFEVAGATVVADQKKIYSESDLVLRLKKPSVAEISTMKQGATHISFLDPFNEPDLVRAACKAGINLISLDMLPRTTRAQRMDALSSQANLGGYAAVILAANQTPKIFPMMMTAAGTLEAVKVLIVGAGVAGLQAIATAKRLGARVTGFDTRPVVKEQVESLGAKFLEINLGTVEQAAGGYAGALTEEQLKIQRDALTKACSQSDVVITTAQVFGKKAPLIVTRPMLEKMMPGSIVIDMAVDSGGNVEGAEPNKTVELNGVKIIGVGDLPNHVALSATQMYANNLLYFIETFFDSEKSNLIINTDDEIIKGCLITQLGHIVNEMVASKIKE